MRAARSPKYMGYDPIGVSGQRAMVAELYAELRPALIRALVATSGSYRGVEDAVQEAFVAFLQADYDEIVTPAGWLYRVAARQLRRQERRGWLTARRLPEAAASQTALLDQVVARVDLISVLAGLSSRDRQLVVAKYYLGLRQDEIAAEFGIPRGTVSAAISRSSVRLRRALSAEAAEA